jgi:Transglycosylase SLT domain
MLRALGARKAAHLRVTRGRGPVPLYRRDGNVKIERRKLSIAALVCGLTLAALSSRAARADQIVLVVDQHGHKVFVNTNEPAPNPFTRTIRGSRFYPSPHSPQIDQLVQQAARQHNLDPKLVQAVIQVESDYDPKAVSNKGAQGLMQLIPETAQRFGVQDPFNMQQNIEGGTSYLKYLLDLFGGNVQLALAAYDAGENSVQRNGGIPPYQETRHYVQKVTTLYEPGKNFATLQPARHTAARIREYVDANGVIHFTNMD